MQEFKSCAATPRLILAMAGCDSECTTNEFDRTDQSVVITQDRNRKPKWVPISAHLTNFRSSAQTSSSSTRKRARRRRREQREEERPQKAISPSLASSCSSDSSGLGSFSSGSVTRLRAESTDALESSGCSSVGVNDEVPLINGLCSERDCEGTILQPTPSAQNDATVDWTNPTLQRYYEKQRAMYRQIYDQHFASLRYAADFSLSGQFRRQCATARRGSDNPNRSSSQSVGLSAQQIGQGKQRNSRIRKLRLSNDKNDEFALSMSEMDPLTTQIYHFQKSIEQTPASLVEKLHLRDLLYLAICRQYAGSGLYIVGSTLNGFGNSSSDMDLCLMITHHELDQRVDAILVLTKLMGCLRDEDWVKSVSLIPAKVPILRATFHEPFDKITVDLNLNNSVAIRNTHLLAYYSGYDWRVRPLVCAVKAWAKRRGINNANQSSLTSYSLVLLVIHYLQCGTKPPILPSLQELYKAQFAIKKDIRELDISEPLKPVQGWELGRSNVSPGELLVGFFRYYASEFDFDTQAISVRRGRAVPRADVVTNKSPHNSLSQWRCICIEEPILQTNAAHAVYDERIFQCIKQSFEIAACTLEKNRDLDALLNIEPIDFSM